MMKGNSLHTKPMQDEYFEIILTNLTNWVNLTDEDASHNIYLPPACFASVEYFQRLGSAKFFSQNRYNGRHIHVDKKNHFLNMLDLDFGEPLEEFQILFERSLFSNVAK